jgi:hypothetical protein
MKTPLASSPDDGKDCTPSRELAMPNGFMLGSARYGTPVRPIDDRHVDLVVHPGGLGLDVMLVKAEHEDVIDGIHTRYARLPTKRRY